MTLITAGVYKLHFVTCKGVNIASLMNIYFPITKRLLVFFLEIGKALTILSDLAKLNVHMFLWNDPLIKFFKMK